MDEWENLLVITNLDCRHFTKLLQNAGTILKLDLASFEFEWIVSTLLFQPINLLKTVSDKRDDEIWSRAVNESFKLLKEIVEDKRIQTEEYYEDIVKLCLLPYEPQIRKNAIYCLVSLAKKTYLAASNFQEHLMGLEQMSTCRAPLATLIGTICEHHPEVAAENITRVWRLLLCMLDCSKSTDTVYAAALQAKLGIFKNFGPDLPILELNLLYDKIAKKFLYTPKCERVCLSILETYAQLFKERVRDDLRTRTHLWRLLQNGNRVAANALIAIYKTMKDSTEEEMKRLADAELSPHVRSHQAPVKYCALRAHTALRLRIPPDAESAQSLEFALREDTVTYETVEAVAWYIEAGLPDCDKLLQTAILFYSSIPTAKRDQLFTDGILKNSDSELRMNTIKFLTNETCTTINGESNLDKYWPLWVSLLDSENFDDEINEKSIEVLKAFMDYTAQVLAAYVEEGCEFAKELPDKIDSLLWLTSRILDMKSNEDQVLSYRDRLTPYVVECVVSSHATASAVAATRASAIGKRDPALRRVSEWIRIDRCTNEQSLREVCLYQITVTDEVNKDVLPALKIFFSRRDVEPKILSKALKVCDSLIDDLTEMQSEEILTLASKMYRKLSSKDKESRILKRDLLIFLGKHGRNKIVSTHLLEQEVIMKLKADFNLVLPNPNEGVDYKINFQRMLELAVDIEDPDFLQSLLALLCCEVSKGSEPRLASAICAVVRSLAACHVRGAKVDLSTLQYALGLCASTSVIKNLIQMVSEEHSPGVKKLVSDAIEFLVLSEQRENGEEMSYYLAESTIKLLSSNQASIRTAIYLADAVLSSMKENNALCKMHLPRLMKLLLKSMEFNSKTTFETAAKLFLEKKELFGSLDDVLKDMVDCLLAIDIGDENRSNDENTGTSTEASVIFFKMAAALFSSFAQSLNNLDKGYCAELPEIFLGNARNYTDDVKISFIYA